MISVRSSRERTWPYGTRKTVKVERVDNRAEFAGTLAIEELKREGFIIINKHEENAVVPVKGGQFIIEFTEGGPTGGYWRYVEQVNQEQN